jgi:prepilin-type processing-associated H-X9-DG protein
VYDADGQRLLRRHPSGNVLYLDGTELADTRGAVTAIRYHTLGDSTIAMREAASVPGGWEPRVSGVPTACEEYQPGPEPTGPSRGGDEGHCRLKSCGHAPGIAALPVAVSGGESR